MKTHSYRYIDLPVIGMYTGGHGHIASVDLPDDALVRRTDIKTGHDGRDYLRLIIEEESPSELL